MKFLKRIPKSARFVCSVAFFAAAFCGFLFANRLNARASESGERIGSVAGKVTGWAVGSFDGITKGNAAGFRDGKQEGLSAQDTTAEIQKIKEIGKLEVLVASANIKDVNKVGDDYGALYLLRASVVFTVDLEQADFDLETSSILIPAPESRCYMDLSEIEKIAEYQKTFFTGSTEAGFIEYMNSLKKINEVNKESIDNYDYLLDSAEQAAIHQVELLTENIRIQDGKLNVKFLENPLTKG